MDTTDKISAITYYAGQLTRMFETCAWKGEERREKRNTVKAFGSDNKSMPVEKIPPTLALLFSELALDRNQVPEEERRRLAETMLRLHDSCRTLRRNPAVEMPRPYEVAFYLVEGYVANWQRALAYGH